MFISPNTAERFRKRGFAVVDMTNKPYIDLRLFGDFHSSAILLLLILLGLFQRVFDRFGPVSCDLHIDLDRVRGDRITSNTFTAAHSFILGPESLAFRN
jgi:hypothetical protein